MDIWTIVVYIVGILFNIGAVITVREAAYRKGKDFLSSGRFAVIAVFILCLLELLVVGRFEALNDAKAFVDLLNQAWIMAGATIGTHTAGITALRR